jgi:hypothetical protein
MIESLHKSLASKADHSGVILEPVAHTITRRITERGKSTTTTTCSRITPASFLPTVGTGTPQIQILTRRPDRASLRRLCRKKLGLVFENA